MDERRREYEFGGKVYIQTELVWGQVRQLVATLENIEFKGDLTVPNLIQILGDALPTALAVVLTEKGQSIITKDLEALAEQLTFTIPVATTIQVIEDFFVFNQTASILEKVNGMVSKLLVEQKGLEEKMEKMKNIIPTPK